MLAYQTEGQIIKLAESVKEILDDADRRFISGRFFKKKYEWVSFVNEALRHLPDHFILQEEAKSLVVGYDVGLSWLDRSHKPLLNLIVGYIQILQANPMAAAGAAIGLFKYYDATLDFHNSEEGYRACQIVFRTYGARRWGDNDILCLRGKWNTVASQYLVDMRCYPAGIDLNPKSPWAQNVLG